MDRVAGSKRRSEVRGIMVSAAPPRTDTLRVSRAPERDSVEERTVLDVMLEARAAYEALDALSAPKAPCITEVFARGGERVPFAEAS